MIKPKYKQFDSHPMANRGLPTKYLLTANRRASRARWLGIVLAICLSSWAQASETPPSLSSPGNLSSPHSPMPSIEWGGRIKASGVMSWPDDTSIFETVGTRTYYDGSLNGRVTSSLRFSDWARLETHYEAVLLGGDTRRKLIELERLLVGTPLADISLNRQIEDQRRVFDLTHTISEEDNYRFYHRLDRLVLSFLPTWGTLKIGRQALTWGNGLIFNPMDLFNPFAPTEIDRDYKVGDDMAVLLADIPDIGEAQLLYVPRRDPRDGELAWDQTSLATKLHTSRGTLEVDLMAAKHFRDVVTGIGFTGLWKDAVWRCDATWTVLDDGKDSDAYLSLVANIDYAWVWWQRNLYGILEFYYNGLGQSDYSDALVNENIRHRLERGELFVLGRIYMGNELQLEIHPLVRLSFTNITNLEDPSGILQPRILWDVTQDMQLLAGLNLFYGEEGTEFGGFPLTPGSPLLQQSPSNVFVQVTWYF